MLICPNCNSTLKKNDFSYICENNHSFDISKTSHINLLISSKTDLGDNKDMVRARTDFLSRDYYKPLATKLCNLIPSGKIILDCGCGQGYYTKQIADFASNIYATDISKHAVIHASKNDKKTQYFVGNAFNLPIKESSIDVITSIFAPLSTDEFYRVLKKDGKALVVVSGEDHLFELKQKVYENPYKNDENKHDFADFSVKTKEKLTYTVCIEKNEDIKHLFNMTPYAFKTSIEDMKKLDFLENLDVTLDFAIYILEK
ncbi:MAG: methyltransferase domain-containing protein [Clostridia bacterium]